MQESRHLNSGGFTLIELAIVLVIIGLIVGGIMVGQNLITAAGVRAQVTQIEKYNQATNTFRGKYGYLPGDINAMASAQFGFTPRAGTAGQGDGNGLIEGYASGNGNSGFWEGAGETVMFWVDLTTANGLNVNLIEGGFNTATPNNAPGSIIGTYLNQYFPQAKIGGGNYIYVYSNNGLNYYGLYNIGSVAFKRQFNASNYSLSVAQAYAIDSKMDDGYPQSGNVMAQWLNAGQLVVEWAGSGATDCCPTPVGAPPGAAISESSTTCYDNGNNASAPMTYSMTQNNGAGANCALSFKMQAGD